MAFLWKASCSRGPFSTGEVVDPASSAWGTVPNLIPRFPAAFSLEVVVDSVYEFASLQVCASGAW